MHKNASIAIFIIFLATAVMAQEYAIDKGSTIVAGMASFTSQGGDLYADSDDNRATSLTISPIVNHFFAPNVAIGAAVAYTREAQDDNSYHTLGIGPTLSYFIGAAKSATFPYLSAGIRYYNIGNEGDEHDTIGGTDIVLGGGILATINGHIGIVIEAGYHIMNLKHKDWDESMSGNIFSVGIGIAGLFY